MGGLREKYMQASPDPKFQAKVAGGRPNPGYGSSSYNVLTGKYNAAAPAARGGGEKIPGFGQMINDLWNYFFGDKNKVSWRQ